MLDLVAHCPTCSVADACRFAFGKYWDAKSGAGEGCRHPLTETHATSIRGSKAFIRANGNGEATQSAFDTNPLASKSDVEREWSVMHLRKRYSVMATDAEEAEVKAFKMVYGSGNMSDVAPFYTSQKKCGELSLSGIAERLRRMA